MYRFVVAVSLAAASFGVFGATLNLHGTGFDAAGNPLASSSTSGGTDGSWSVAGGPAFFIAPGNADWWDGGIDPTNAYAANTNTATFNGSGWISDNATTPINGPVPYSFEMKFDLSDFDLSTVAISGAWSIADGGTLSINGNVIETFLPGDNPWRSLHPFTVGPSRLNAGENTVSLTVLQGARFLEAARFEGVVTGTVVPEPGTFAFLATGALMLVACRRKIRHASFA